jgi:hypothetical protein
VIFVETKGPWCTADPMLHVYVCRVIEMFIRRIRLLEGIQGHFYVKDAVHNQLWLGVLKRKFHFVRIVIG